MKKLKYIYTFLLILSFFIPIFQVNANADIASSLSGADLVIVLTDYEIVNGSLEIGNEFTIKVTIRNYNNYADAFNIVAEVFTEDINLRLVDVGVNQVYIDTLKAGESISFSQTFAIEEDYPFKTAMLTYNFNYSNATGTEFTNKTIITPKVVTPCKLTINVLSVSSSANVGSRSLANIRCTNSGIVDISNITMKIEGDIAENQKNVDLGALASEEQLMKDCYVNFTTSGEQKLSIAFEYNDKDGNVFTIEPKEYDITVNPSQSISVDKKKSDGVIRIGGLEIKTVWFLFFLIFTILVIVLMYMNYKTKHNEKEES